MTDPFSVVGSAVGVVSLGITACKGLVWYINSAADAKENTASISARLDSLVKALDLLEKVVEGLDSSQCASATSAVASACSAAVASIRKKLGKPDRTKDQSFRTRLQNLKLCLLYPFKQEELAYWKNALEGIQQDLQIALLALQLEQQHQHSENIMNQLTQNSRISQLGFETTAQKQGQLHVETIAQLADQTSLVRSGFLASENNFHEIQQNAKIFQLSLSTVATDVSAISVTLPQLALSVKALEAKFNGMAIQSIISPKDSFIDQFNQQTLSRSHQRMRGRPRQVPSACNCISRAKTVTYLQPPFRFQRTVKTAHDSDCPRSCYEGGMSNTAVEISFCSSALGSKVRFMLESSIRAGLSLISPSLVHYHVVPYSAPAFNLFDTARREEWRRIRDRHDRSITAGEYLAFAAAELLRLFQERTASPHDRLPDGKSLLHYYCSNAVSLYLNDINARSCYHAVGLQLLQYVGDLAFEKDDYGFTCLDYISVEFDRNDLCREFQRIVVPVSIPNLITWPWPRLRDHIYNDPESLEDDSKLVRMVMVRSETALKQLLSQTMDLDLIGGPEGFKLYSLATRLGWARGCEILWSYGVPLAKSSRTSPEVYFNEALLQSALKANDADTLLFWLNLRGQLNAEELHQLGNLEDALDWTVPTMFEILLDEIVQQRKSLQQLAQIHLKDHEYMVQPNGLLDADAFHVLDLLAKRKVYVHPSLRPARRSIWYMSKWRVVNGTIWDTLFNSGFRDLTSTHFGDVAVTPLLYSVNTYARLRAIEWFTSKGASLYETWPRSNTTALHCIAWALGDVSRSWWDARKDGNAPGLTHLSNTTQFFEDRCSDDCTCQCSSSGCLFLTVFGKSFLADDIGFSLHQKLRELGRIVDFLMDVATNNWIASEVIRVAIFSCLGLSHTCCDLTRIHHWEAGDPDVSRSPIPRYPPEETARILEEDSYLIIILEELFIELEGQFTQAQLSLEQFVDVTLIPKMGEVLVKLAEEDDVLYGLGRRKLGVIMEDFTRSSINGE